MTDFLVHYNDKNDIFNNLGYSTTTSKDYYTNGQGIGSRVPLINVPALAYTDSSGKIYKVTVNETINLVDREIRMNVIDKIKYSLNYLKRNSIQSLRNNTTNELETGSGHLVLSDNKLKLDSGIVNNVKRFINTNYHDYLYNTNSYSLRVKAKVLPFNFLINNCKQIDTVNFINKNSAFKNADLVMFNSIQKSKYYYTKYMNGIQNFELDIYHKQGEKTYLTLKDTPLIPNNLIKQATHAITSINDEMYMYVLIGRVKKIKLCQSNI